MHSFLIISLMEARRRKARPFRFKPDLVSAHINACVLMMAEKASDIHQAGGIAPFKQRGPSGRGTCEWRAARIGLTHRQLAPGVPAQRVKVLREAYAAMVQHPDYLKEVAASRLDPNPIRGEELQSTIKELIDMQQAVWGRVKKLA